MKRTYYAPIFFISGLALSLAALVYIVPPLNAGLLGLFLVVLCAMRWGLAGGLFSAFWTSGIMVMLFFAPDPHLGVIELSTAVTAFFGLGAGLGKILDIVNAQKEEIIEKNRIMAGAQQMAHLGIWKKDHIHLEEEWSEEVYRILGRRPGAIEPSSESYLDAVHPADRGYIDNLFKRTLEGGESGYEAEYRVLRKSSGELRHVYEKCRHMKNSSGRIVFSERLVQDITELKKSEKNLTCLYGIGKIIEKNNGLEQTFREAVEFIPDYLSYPRLACARIMYEERHYKSANFSEPESKIEEKLCAGEQDVGKLEVGYIKNPPLSEEKGVFEEAEKQLVEHIAERLGRAIRYRKLFQQLVRAEKLSALGELLAGVAHEINNPLNAMLGFSELLLQDKEDMDEEVAHDIENIYEASQRIEKITRDLLRFARKEEEEKAEIHIIDVLEQTLRLKERHMQSLDITIERDFRRPLPSVKGNKKQIEQVFLNIINNAEYAIRKTGSGGVLTVRASEQAHFVKMEFLDTGDGIPPELIDKVFDPFTSSKPEGEGTGLGLSLGYGIIKEHGGDINASNRPSGGAAITVMLPISE